MPAANRTLAECQSTIKIQEGTIKGLEAQVKELAERAAKGADPANIAIIKELEEKLKAYAELDSTTSTGQTVDCGESRPDPTDAIPWHTRENGTKMRGSIRPWFWEEVIPFAEDSGYSEGFQMRAHGVVDRAFGMGDSKVAQQLHAERVGGVREVSNVVSRDADGNPDVVGPARRQYVYDKLPKFDIGNKLIVSVRIVGPDGQ